MMLSLPTSTPMLSNGLPPVAFAPPPAGKSMASVSGLTVMRPSAWEAAARAPARVVNAPLPPTLL